MRSWLALTGLMTLCACAEVIDLGTEFSTPQLLINGRFTQGIHGNTIELAMTSAVNAQQEPLRGARIVLVAESGATEPYVEVKDGFYELLNEQILGEPGQAYHIEMTLPDGRLFRTDPAVMPNKVATDHLEWKARTQVIPVDRGGAITRNVVEFFVRTDIHNPEEEPLIRWNLMETYLFAEFTRHRGADDPPLRCFVTKTLDVQNVLLYDGSELMANEIPRRTIVARKHDSTFYDAYYFHVVKSSLTPDAFRFWKQIEQTANAQGSIFDQPLAPIRSNVYNINDPADHVLGYFEVSYVDTARVLINDNDIHFRVNRPCRPSIMPEPPECWDCLLIDGATKDLPYWVD